MEPPLQVLRSQVSLFEKALKKSLFDKYLW